jgi:hypothetical protein
MVPRVDAFAAPQAPAPKPAPSPARQALPDDRASIADQVQVQRVAAGAVGGGLDGGTVQAGGLDGSTQAKCAPPATVAASSLVRLACMCSPRRATSPQVHLPRQSLRALLYAGLSPGTVRWGFRFRGARVRREGSSGEAPMDVAAPDEGDHQYAISDAISVTPLDEAAPDDEKEMCGVAAAGVTAAGVAASTRPCHIVQVTVEQYRDQAQHGGHGEGAEESAPLPLTCRTVLAKALVGADGIRSAVRAALVQESGEADSAPLRALQVIVIL